jgi:hypothetical protein
MRVSSVEWFNCAVLISTLRNAVMFSVLMQEISCDGEVVYMNTHLSV